MPRYTRSGRPALEQAFKGPGHWHVEGWCVIKENHRMWSACDGGCTVIGHIEDNSKEVFATTLNDMRDRIREEIFSPAVLREARRGV